MAQKRFGSVDSTGRKLDVIDQYLSIYQIALSSTGFQTLYIDGFAGSGEIPLAEHKLGLFGDDVRTIDEDARTVIAGSADRALNVSPPFSRYVFIDKRRKCIKALQERFMDNPNVERARYLVGDANEHIQALCVQEVWRSQRGVVLLDPFGNQVLWQTVEAIAATKALDLWYLFPAGNGVYRQVSNDGTIDRTHEQSITNMYGTEEWKTAFLKPSQQGDLFGDTTRQEKVVTPESAAEFMIERLRTVFQGGVMDEMIPLGKHAYPSFYLLFAWANPSEKAGVLAKKLSKAAVKATDRKHGRLV